MGTHNPQTYRFFLMTVDPVHIGTGGARLGRVDNPIVREPGTHLPKIPGSSLHGMIRAYAAHRYGKPQCAGQGKTHCARPTCPICYTFGYARNQGGGHAGVVAIADARILLFPVYSMVGPVWVTSPAALEAAGVGKHEVASDKAKWGGGNSELPVRSQEQKQQQGQVQEQSQNQAQDQKQGQEQHRDYINLGWLMVGRESDLPDLKLPGNIPEQIRKRVVLVSDKLFSQIVNSNLEVRTSVAINPETGAAEEGALFTYEAIPRATVLWMDVVVSDYRGRFPDKRQWEKICSGIEENVPEEMPDSEMKIEEALRRLGYIDERPEKGKGEPDAAFEQRRRKYWERVKRAQKVCQNVLSGLEWSTPLDVVDQGLQWAEHLGVGGMGTRGFGRIRELACTEVKDNGFLEKSCQQDAHGDTEGTVNAEG